MTPVGLAFMLVNHTWPCRSGETCVKLLTWVKNDRLIGLDRSMAEFEIIERSYERREALVGVARLKTFFRNVRMHLRNGLH